MVALYYEPITPGEYLEHEFLKPLSLTQTQLAQDIDVPISRISGIIHGSRSITVDTAVRLGIYFKTSAEMWMNLQTQYDLQKLEKESLNTIKSRIRPLALKRAG